MTLTDPLSLVGTTVSDKYEIESVVGEGGFAVVYRARHTVWNRAVAIKVFRALGDLPPDRRIQLVDAFIQEGRLLADLSERSAAICQARDVGTLKARDGREMPYLVLEWLQGQSLEQVLDSEKQRHLPPRTAEQTLRLLEPAAEALALAHRKGIAHRDVKPANIFILGDPRGDLTVKLLDFGIAKVVQDAQRLGGSFAQTQGVVSSFTPAYGAPEQFSRSHGSTGPWTDVFSLALIFTELMTHEPPLRGDDLTQLAFASMDPKRRPTPRTQGANISDATEEVMRRALAVSPDERFRSMGEFWEALRRSLGMEPSRAFATTDPSTTSGPIQPQLATPPMVPPPSDRTMPTATGAWGPTGSPSPTLPQPVVKPASGHGGPTALVAVGGVVITLLLGAALIGAWAFVIRKDPSKRGDTMASASISASAPPPVPAPEVCPPGMTKIPGGKYFMGSDDRKDNDDERPAHQVTLSTYCMDITEVTVAAYKACSDRGECKRAPAENEWEGIDAPARKLYDPLCNIREPDTKAAYPINCLDWSLANAFCAAVGKRLPTEAEWEFATRGSDGRKYPWGDDPPSNGGFLNACGKECVAWGKKHPDPDNPLIAMYNVDDGWPTTAPVGSFPKGASVYGLQDVVGNVWEWVSDWYAPYTAETTTNPQGPSSGEQRVLRGGAWNGSDVAWVRPTYRFRSDPKLRSHGIGMRCAKTMGTTKL